ncbi:SLC13 family permease [Halalkalibacter krulwichiae]|uniref:SLC13 family permease n=1 Tax=Halalkalibacter krulwichiae TaxID=199441 RepID=UPI0008261F80|nr:anion permease [Halalkalibacter krulwichiae]
MEIKKNIHPTMSFSLNAKVIILFSCFLVVTGSVLIPSTFGLTEIQQRTLGLLIFSIIIWATKAIPTGISSLLIICLQLMLGIVPEFSEGIQGFLSSSIYFILAVSLVSTVMTKVGIDKILSTIILKFSHGNIKKTAIGFFVATLLLPIVMPSGNARLRMFIPLMEEINCSHNLHKNSSFVRFTTWALSGINQVVTLIVITGGGLAVVASQLVVDLGYEVTWSKWFFLMALPIWAITLMTGICMWFFWKMNKLPKSKLHNESKNNLLVSNERSHLPVSMVIVVLSFMLILWIVGPTWNIPIIVPPLLALTFFSLPGIGLLKNSDLRNYDWENFLLLGTAISLAITIEHNGTATWLASKVFSFIGGSSYEVINVLIVLVVVMLIRLLFVSPVASLTVIYPLTIAFSNSVALDPLLVYLSTTIIICSTMILPIHSPILVLANEMGHLFLKESIFIGSILLIISFIVAIFSYFIYWPLLI